MLVVGEMYETYEKLRAQRDRKITRQPGNEPARSFDTALEERKFSDVQIIFSFKTFSLEAETQVVTA